MPTITLTTDFGTRDHYVGAIKGVIRSLAPKAEIIDITHEIGPHDVLHASFVLHGIWPYYPEGTIHLAVVDPGVGSERRIILGRYAGQYVIAPDNGLITFLHRTRRVEEMYVVENRRYFLPQPSSTFHGRDIFAPVAAHLASGVKSRDFGRSTDRVEMLDIPHSAEITGRRIMGRILYVDRFGTLVTNINQQNLLALGIKDRDPEVFVGGQNIGPIRSHFGEVPEGEPLALQGSTGYLEIAVNRGSAAERFMPGEEGQTALAKRQPDQTGLRSLMDSIRVELR